MDAKTIAEQIVSKYQGKATLAAASWNPLSILQDIATYFRQHPEAQTLADQILAEVYALLTNTPTAVTPAGS